jgi:hypothetical protein
MTGRASVMRAPTGSLSGYRLDARITLEIQRTGAPPIDRSRASRRCTTSARLAPVRRRRGAAGGAHRRHRTRSPVFPGPGISVRRWRSGSGTAPRARTAAR